MSRYIDADRFAKQAYEVAYPIVHNINSHERGLTLMGIAQLLDEQPTADVHENVKGEWVIDDAATEHCSVCGHPFYTSALFAVGGNDEPPYCPNCGARM